MGALLIPELLCVSAGIRVHIITVDIIIYSFHILQYHTIYTLLKNDVIPLCILYQNFGEPYKPVSGWYHKMVIPAQHGFEQ
jgi:hypothetical protein